MQQDDRRTVRGAGLGVADVQDAGIDLLERGERRVRSRLDRRQLRRPVVLDCASAEPIRPS